MNLKKLFLLQIFILLLYSCADYRITESIQKKEKKYYSSSGFALIYEDALYSQKIVNKKINIWLLGNHKTKIEFSIIPLVFGQVIYGLVFI